jgi:ectoine hydroxylase-related dioxygenase (phytanoyl-CoA dioxygenase family)
MAAFREEGFFVWEDCLGHESLEEVRRRIDAFDAEHEHRLQAIGREGISRAGEIVFTAHLAEKDPVLSAFVVSPPFLTVIQRLIGPDVALYWDQAVYKRAETRRDFPWHQDNGYTPIVPAQYVTCWVPLDDVTLDMGPVWVRPKTHRLGPQPHRDTPWGRQCYFGDDPGIPVPVRAGSMIVFSSLLMHRSSPNLSGRIRKAYIVQYCHVNSRHGTTGEPLERPAVLRRGFPQPLPPGVADDHC